MITEVTVKFLMLHNPPDMTRAEVEEFVRLALGDLAIDIDKNVDTFPYVLEPGGVKVRIEDVSVAGRSIPAASGILDPDTGERR